MAIIENQAIARRAFDAMRTRRVVCTGFFNSNGLKDGPGIVEALQQAFVAKDIKLFAVGPVTLTSTNLATGENDGNSAARPNASCVGWSRVTTSASASNALLSAANVLALTTLEAQTYTFGRANDGSSVEYPNLYRALHFQNNSAVAYGSVASGISFPAVAANPLHINPAAALRSDHWYANATPDGGTFRPVAIDGAVPNVHVANFGSTITVAAGTATGFVRGTWDVPAGTRTTQMRVGPSGPLASPAEMRPSGEVTFGYQLTWERDALAGVLVAPFVSMGGWSIYDMANMLNRTDGSQMHDAAIDHWIEVTTRPAVDAGQDPMMIFCLYEGSNQSTETVASVTKGLAAATWQSWADNAIYIMSRITQRWLRLGFKARDLVFAIHPDHPRGGDLNTAQAEYRTLGLPYICDRFPDQAFGLDGDAAWTFDELLNLGPGTQSLYARNPSAQTATAIAASSGGNCVVTVNNSYAAGDYVTIAGSNSSPNIDGTYALVARTASSITIARGDVTGTGTTASIRTIDRSHLAVTGTSAATINGYQLYWSRMAGSWAAASPNIGQGALTGGGGGWRGRGR